MRTGPVRLSSNATSQLTACKKLLQTEEIKQQRVNSKRAGNVSDHKTAQPPVASCIKHIKERYRSSVIDFPALNF